MLKGLGSFLGYNNETASEEKVTQTPVNEVQQNDTKLGIECATKEQFVHHINEDDEESLSAFLLSLASSASQTLASTAGSIWRGMDKHRIDGILENSILGAFQKEHKKFLREKQCKSIVPEAAIPPWVGYNDEETMQQLILALSVDRRNFLCDPPGGVEFHFDFEAMFPVALVMLQEDELLSQMRFALVPKLVKEEQFWRNYFYRVSLIKQSAALEPLASPSSEESAHEGENDLHVDGIGPSDLHIIEAKSETSIIPETSLSPNDVNDDDSSAGSEFVSDEFDTTILNSEELSEEMKRALENGEDATLDWQNEFDELLQGDS